MDLDLIKKIWIDNTGALCVQPKTERFEYIYRSAMGVYWNSPEGFLYPRLLGSWSPTDWFRQILAAVKNEYGCKLYLAPETNWLNIDEITRESIESEYKKGERLVSSDFIDWFNNNRGKHINIEIAGEIFGGRYGESPQLVYDFEISEQKIKIYFEPSEKLIITNPSLVMMGSDNELIVSKSAQVEFGWHFYGKLRIQENWCTVTYDLKENDLVEYKCTGPISSYIAPHRTFILGGHDFLRLI
jgi:hypothetical protein